MGSKQMRHASSLSSTIIGPTFQRAPGVRFCVHERCTFARLTLLHGKQTNRMQQGHAKVADQGYEYERSGRLCHCNASHRVSQQLSSTSGTGATFTVGQQHEMGAGVRSHDLFAFRLDCLRTNTTHRTSRARERNPSCLELCPCVHLPLCPLESPEQLSRGQTGPPQLLPAHPVTLAVHSGPQSSSCSPPLQGCSCAPARCSVQQKCMQRMKDIRHAH